jgi:hypothetical protein
MTTTVQTQSEYRDLPLDWLVAVLRLSLHSNHSSRGVNQRFPKRCAH